jgi:uncharacterized iron-regulated membrane protein
VTLLGILLLLLLIAASAMIWWQHDQLKRLRARQAADLAEQRA